VGRRLALLAERRQVIVVTHFPRSRSFADRHVRVQKQPPARATVEVLDDPGRVAGALSHAPRGCPAERSASDHREQLLAERRRARLPR